MSKYKQKLTSVEAEDTAMAIAMGTKKPNQTKEQTKLIAQGIQKGIAEYKKQQKNKARASDKQKKKVAHKKNRVTDETPILEQKKCKVQWVPWTLLVLTWLCVAVYISNFMI